MTAMWVWGAIGLALLAIEMATGTFYVLWFGISALCTALATGILPQLPTAMQFVIFALLSIGSLAIWKFNDKKTETHSRVGQAQGEEIGRTGTVIAACSSTQTGKIEFAQGLMGSREWTAVSDETIDAGASATVVAVEGNALRVKKS